MKKEGEQTLKGACFRGGVDVEIGDRIGDNINKLRFLADCFASGNIEMTDQGRDGCYRILSDIATDLNDAITEPASA